MKNKKIGIGSLSLLLVIIAFVWAFNIFGVCVGDHILATLNIPTWSNMANATGTHYTIFYSFIFLIPALILSIKYKDNLVPGIKEFLMSDTGQRMAKADDQGNLFREKPFVMECDGVLVQGIIDVFWIEDDKIILLDYKTDRVDSADELVTKYKTQLLYYADALSRIFSTEEKTYRADEMLIYSFRLREVIKI